jgi:hypothetical protein
MDFPSDCDSGESFRVLTPRLVYTGAMAKLPVRRVDKAIRMRVCYSKCYPSFRRPIE